ncbi:MAG: AAA family ATPase [Euryarchaeota archaeon]|nr:AAA family ATPase [Euryarchaeota archaeon]MDE1881121.1 AAA family ATPase [Euryarchaeota archaeon]
MKHPASSRSRSRAPAFFLLLRGPLGVGKSTVARALSRKLAAKVVSMDRVVDRWAWDGGSERLFLRANVVAAEIARPSLERAVPVIFDGCFYWRKVIEDLRARLPYPSRVVTLRAPLAVCIERDSERRTSYGEGSARAVYRKVRRERVGTSVDASGDLTSTVEAVLALLNGRGRSGDDARAPATREGSGPGIRRAEPRRKVQASVPTKDAGPGATRAPPGASASRRGRGDGGARGSSASPRAPHRAPGPGDGRARARGGAHAGDS